MFQQLEDSAHGYAVNEVWESENCATKTDSGLEKADCGMGEVQDTE